MTDIQAVSCGTMLSYSGYLEWDMKMFSKDYSRYLDHAVLTLRSNGRRLSTAQYHSSELDLNKCSGTGSKLGQLIKQLLTYIPLAGADRTAPPVASKSLRPAAD